MSDPSSPLARLGAILKLLRTARGLELADLAERSGVELEMLREVEETRGVTPLHLSHLDAILVACGLSLSDLAQGEKALLAGEEPGGEGAEKEVDTLLRTIETLQDRIDSLEFQRGERHSATVRAFQVQTIKLLEKAMETSGMSQEDMRRLVSDMQIEDVG